MKLIPVFPYCDLDGTPWPRCAHHSFPNERERAVIRGIGDGIIAAGIPELPFHAGEIVTTSWGCKENKRMKTRQAFIYRVHVVLVRHPQSMFFMPTLQYAGWPVLPDGTPDYFPSGGMYLEDGQIADLHWTAAPRAPRECGSGECSQSFWLEQISPVTRAMQTVPGVGVHFVFPKGDASDDHMGSEQTAL